MATWLRTHWEATESRATSEGNVAFWFPVRVGHCPAQCPTSGLSQGFLEAGLRGSAVRSLQAHFLWNICLLVSGFWIFSQSPKPVVEYSSRSWTSMSVSLSSAWGNNTLLPPNTFPVTPRGCAYSGFSHSCPYNIVIVLSQNWRWDLNPV